MDRSCAFETKWLKGSATLTKVRLTALLKGFLIPGQIKSNELYPARAQFFVLQLLANGNNLTPEMFNLLIAVFLVVSLFSSINAAGAIEPYTSIRYNEPYVITRKENIMHQNQNEGARTSIILVVILTETSNLRLASSILATKLI